MQLTPDLLLKAYAIGIFPMAESRHDPELHWIDPELRGILPLDNLHVPRKLRRIIRRRKFEIRCDSAFREVIVACAEPGENRPDTWINSSIEQLYEELFEMGFAHSVECWREDRLVGGLYGVSLGGAFFGESMFSRESEASKVALVDTSLQFGDVGVLLNLYASRTSADLAVHADELDDELIEDVFIAHSSGVKALLAPPKPEEADTVTPALITKVLGRLRSMFDIIIVDTSSVLDDVVLSVMDLSDKIIVVTTPEIPAIKNAKLFFEVTEALEYDRDRIMFVLNKADKRVNIRAEDIESNIKYRIEGQLPLDERSVTNAVNQGVPFVLGDKNSVLTQATIILSKTLNETLHSKAETVEAPVRTGIFGR